MLLNIVIVVILNHITYQLNSIYSELYSSKILKGFDNALYQDQEVNIVSIPINDIIRKKIQYVNSSMYSKCEELNEEDLCVRKQGCCYCKPRLENLEGKHFCFNFKTSFIFNVINELTFEDCACFNGYQFNKKKIFKLFFWMYIAVSLMVYKCLHFFLYFFDGIFM